MNEYDHNEYKNFLQHPSAKIYLQMLELKLEIMNLKIENQKLRTEVELHEKMENFLFKKLTGK